MKIKEVVLFLLFLFKTPLMAQEVVFDPAKDHSDVTGEGPQSIEKTYLGNTIKIEVSNSIDDNKSGNLNNSGYYSIHINSTLTISIKGDLKIVKVDLIREKEDKNSLKNLELPSNIDGIISKNDDDEKIWLGYRDELSLNNTSNAVHLSKIIITLNIFKISEAGFATMWLDNSYIMPEGVIGHYITIKDGKLKYLYNYFSGERVKAELPLLIESVDKTGTAKTYKYEVAEYKRYIIGNSNKLRKSIGIEVTAPADEIFYKFSYDSDGKNLGFYWDSDDGKTINIPYGKCYLAISKDELSSSGASNAKGFILSDIVNGIDNVIDTTPEMDTKVYDLRGIFMGYSFEGLPKGIYIQNGKKIVIK